MTRLNTEIDTTIEIVTPENIAFRYRLAGPLRRLMAFVIDMMIQAAVTGLAAFALLLSFGSAGVEGIGAGGTLVILFLLNWFYGGLFEALWNGQTPGKRAMSIRVLTIDGRPINGLQAVMRNVLRAVDLQPLTFGMLGLVTAAMNDRFQRLGDLAAGTMVVLEERSWLRGLVRVTEPEALRLAAEIPAQYMVSRSLGRALAAYVQRRKAFAPPRRREIALHLAEPLREQFHLPADTSPDMLLCGLYYRTFVTDRDDVLRKQAAEARAATRQPPASPFLQRGEAGR